MALVSIQSAPHIRYPRGNDFSPSVCYEEYPWKEHPLGAGDVYAMVRECLLSYHSGSGGTGPNHNLLGTWIRPGERVMILPNMVMHRRALESAGRFSSKCTHGSVLRAVVDYAVLANGDATRVKIGNAPIQSCDYARVSKETGILAVKEFYADLGFPDMGPHDLRSFTSKRTFFGALLETKCGDPDQVVNIDLGKESLLEDLFRTCQPRLRIGDYPPESIMSYHGPGKHIYAVSRRVLDADVIVSVPKLKTHQKVGITCALKGTVGAIARKECLAHHRQGSPRHGGDEYPRHSQMRHLASLLADRAGSLDTSFRANVMRVFSKAYNRLFRVGSTGIMGGGWYGNDTAWRMTLDIARLLLYARADGTISNVPVRRHIGLVDGIVGGQGEGPLRPVPRQTSAVLFSPDACSLDFACALIMGYDPLKIPLIKNAFLAHRYPITPETIQGISILLNGESASGRDVIRKFGPAYRPPKGWRGHLEAEIP